jgi:hypothetical protein
VCLKLPCVLSSQLEEGEIILEPVQKILAIKKEMVAAQWRHPPSKLLPCTLSHKGMHCVCERETIFTTIDPFYESFYSFCAVRMWVSEAVMLYVWSFQN